MSASVYYPIGYLCSPSKRERASELPGHWLRHALPREERIGTTHEHRRELCARAHAKPRVHTLEVFLDRVLGDPECTADLCDGEATHRSGGDFEHSSRQGAVPSGTGVIKYAEHGQPS